MSFPVPMHECKLIYCNNIYIFSLQFKDDGSTDLFPVKWCQDGPIIQFLQVFFSLGWENIFVIWMCSSVWKGISLGRRCPSINRWRVRNVRGGLRWPRWRERKYRVGIYFVFFWLKLAVFMVIRQYWKAPILYMLYEILWVVIVVPCTQKNHVLCIQLAILQSYSTTNL